MQGLNKLSVLLLLDPTNPWSSCLSFMMLNKAEPSSTCSILHINADQFFKVQHSIFQYGDTALHTAARYGHAGVTRILISARCRLNEQNKVYTH